MARSGISVLIASVSVVEPEIVARGRAEVGGGQLTASSRSSCASDAAQVALGEGASRERDRVICQLVVVT